MRICRLNKSTSIGRPAAAFYWTDTNSSAILLNSAPFLQRYILSRDKHRMATRVIKLREAEEPAPEMVQEVLSQSKRPEVGRFLLQVDRQTKRSYATAEAAEKAGMVIKKGHPIVRVSVYDSVETANKIIELPAGSPPTS